MAKYFQFSRGLRGCYMPEIACVLRVNTRRELKDHIEREREWLGDDVQGLSKRAIAAFVAEMWREAQKARPAYLPNALPYKTREESSYANAIFLSVATREEFKEYEANRDDY